MATNKRGAFGCVMTIVVALAFVVLAVALMGIVVEQGRARVRAGLGFATTSENGADVDGLPDDVTVGGPRVDTGEWTPTPVRVVDNRGIRKGLIHYPRIGGPHPFIDRGIAWNLDSVLAEYPMRINYAFRPTWRQRQLYQGHLRRKNPNGVARPGTSIHESGCAVDTDFRSISPDAQRRKVAVFARYGFTWKGRFEPGGKLAGDPVHFEIRPERIGWASAVEAIRYNQTAYRLLGGE